MARTSNLTNFLTDVADAIRTKKGSSGAIQASNFDTEILSIPSGGSAIIEEKDVNFYDYDGTLLESWSLQELQGKTALPSLPSNHSKLIAQGWNWTLANLKTQNTKMNVGVMYETVSGLTEIDVSMTKITGKTITVNMTGNKNWGDGTADNLTTHTYNDYGDYTITCNGTSIPAGSSSTGGMFGSTTSNNNRFWCTAIRIGKRVTSIGNYALRNCYSLSNITIPNTVTSIGTYGFYYNYSLKDVTIPNTVTSIGNNTFYACNSLNRVIIPNSITSIGSYGFSSDYSLKDVTIPNTVTSIGTYGFSNSYSLKDVTIPNSITSIGNNTFSGCYSLIKYDFSSATQVKTLSNTNSFSNINGICKIIVPDNLYNDWIEATNWSTYADYIYKASEVD